MKKPKMFGKKATKAPKNMLMQPVDMTNPLEKSVKKKGVEKPKMSPSGKVKKAKKV